MTVPWKSKTQPEYAKQERRTSKKPGARLQVNSGRTWSGLRDVIQDIPLLGRVLIDNKTGKNGPLKSYRLTEQDWAELKRDANRTPPGCYPSLQIDLGKFRLMVIEEGMWDEVGRLLSER